MNMLINVKRGRYTMPTLRDIASRSGVSLSTVSRVMNGHPSVAPGLVTKVLETAAELGYEKTPRNNEKQTLAVLVTWPSTSESQTQRDSQFAMMFLHSIYVTAERLGYHLVFHFGTEEGKINSFLQWQIATKQFQGAIIVGSYLAMERTYVESLQKGDLPFFRLSKAPTDFNAPHSYVAVDDYAGGYKAGRHLADLGAKSVLHILGPSNSRDALERKKGFVKACEEHGLRSDAISFFQGDFHEPAGEKCAQELIRRGELPDGIFAANDMMAIGCMRTLQKHSVRIPADVRIVGFDNIMLASYVEPALTTIQIPFDDLARVATEELVKQIECPLRKTTRVLLDAELIVRKSCGA